MPALALCRVVSAPSLQSRRITRRRAGVAPRAFRGLRPAYGQDGGDQAAQPGAGGPDGGGRRCCDRRAPARLPAEAPDPPGAGPAADAGGLGCPGDRPARPGPRSTSSCRPFGGQAGTRAMRAPSSRPWLATPSAERQGPSPRQQPDWELHLGAEPAPAEVTQDEQHDENDDDDSDNAHGVTTSFWGPGGRAPQRDLRH